ADDADRLGQDGCTRGRRSRPVRLPQCGGAAPGGAARAGNVETVTPIVFAGAPPPKDNENPYKPKSGNGRPCNWAITSIVPTEGILIFPPIEPSMPPAGRVISTLKSTSSFASPVILNTNAD